MRVAVLTARVPFAAAAAAALIVLGVGLRLRQLCTWRSLWMDEAMLAVNVVERSAAALAQPLEYNQGAPLGFLLMQKAAVLMLGLQDWTLRLLPFAASVVALVLMARVATSWLGGAGLLAVGLLAVGTPVVEYSTEAKQYAVDVAAALALLWATMPWLDGERWRHATTPPTWSRRWVVVPVGAIAVWCSHPAAFGLCGTAAVVIAAAARQRRALPIAVAAITTWAASAALLYWLSLETLASNSALLQYWRGAFWPAGEAGSLSWLRDAVRAFIAQVGALQPASWAAGLAVVGVASQVRRSPPIAMLFTAPLLAAVVASAAGKYPFSGRLLLFAVPCLYLAVAAGVRALASAAARAHRAAGVAVAASLTVVVLYSPVGGALRSALQPRAPEDLRPALEHLLRRLESSDRVYVYYGAKPAFRFYAHALPLPKDGVALGRAHRGDPAAYAGELDAAAPQGRLWLVFAHECPTCAVPERSVLIRHLEARGRRLDAYETNGAGVYLYEIEKR
ncbi:MAG TPA: hypothetical protein VEC57_17515 [Candidatus Limnocylindrales bacterium]|nr:hypothetical protein [Candidatus Limnocylindrales bacterium]